MWIITELFPLEIKFGGSLWGLSHKCVAKHRRSRAVDQRRPLFEKLWKNTHKLQKGTKWLHKVTNESHTMTTTSPRCVSAQRSPDSAGSHATRLHAGCEVGLYFTGRIVTECRTASETQRVAAAAFYI